MPSDVAGDRAIAQRDQNLGAPGPSGSSQVVFVGDRAFDQRDVHLSGKSLSRSAGETSSTLAGELEQPFVHIEKRHVAAGAAVQPHRCQTWFRASLDPLLLLPRGHDVWQEAAIFAHLGDRSVPLSHSAPVGHTWTHLPQLVQLSDSPQGCARSVITRDCCPATHDVPGVRALDFVANPHAAGAQDAAVLVEPKRSWLVSTGSVG